MTDAAAARFTATFSPEAWVDNWAVPVDAEGPTRWDPTDFLNTQPSVRDQFFAELTAEAERGFGDPSIIDANERLYADPAIPVWATQHSGPFTIRVGLAD